MDWIEVTLAARQGMLDRLCVALENLDIEGYSILDEGEFEGFLRENAAYWDYVDDSLYQSVKGKSEVTFYLPDNPASTGKLKEVQAKTAAFTESFSSKKVRDEDWENNWKQYYKPVETGSRLVIVPEWEDTPENGRLPVRLDPGLIFGTGTHPTTVMCLEQAEKYAPHASSVLDLGCGSGILSIAALILGAKYAIGCDIDPKAPKTAASNAALNGKELPVLCGDILTEKTLAATLRRNQHDIVFANIVADVIIALTSSVKTFMSPGAVFICSGIIDGRETEVQNALENEGFTIIEHMHKEDWHGFVAKI